MLSIAVVSYHSSPLDPPGSGKSGGMSICISQLYRELSRFCEIDIFTCGEHHVEFLNPNLRVVHLPCENIEKFSDTCIHYYLRRRYDVLHTHYWLSGMVGLSMLRRISVPWVHTLHTVEMLKSNGRDRLRIEIEDEIMRSCDLVISPTEREAFALTERLPGASVAVIPHGVNVRQFTPSQNGHTRLLFVGRIDPIKGLDVLVDALRIAGGDIRLDIVGGASKGIDNLENLRAYAEGLPVHFHGTVRHEEIATYYQNSSILVVPSYYESFGLVALEAMASARPVVGFRDTGLAETVGNDAGILVERNARNLGQALTYLLERHDQCRRLGLRGRRKAEDYAWGGIAKKYERVYEEICKA